MTEILRTAEIEPRREPAGSVLWLHGLGADGHDFEPIVPMLGRPDLRFVFPHAPARPVTINGGLIMPAWYDILALASAGGGEDAEDVRESALQIEALLAREAERGVPPARTVLAGFSQGGAIALHVGTRHGHALSGIMVLSGYELLADTREAEQGAANHDTPMLFCHGRFDPMVPVARARQAFDAHAHEGRESEWHEFPMAHEVSPEEILVIREWLGRRLPARESGP